MSSERPADRPGASISDFSRRFSAALQGVMRENKIRIDDVVKESGRSKGYVSEHTSGKAAPDTDLVDAVARTIGMTAHALVTEIARRMEPAQRLIDQGYRRVDIAYEPVSIEAASPEEAAEARRVGSALEEYRRSTDPLRPAPRLQMWEMSDEAARDEDREKPQLGDE